MSWEFVQISRATFVRHVIEEIRSSSSSKSSWRKTEVGISTPDLVVVHLHVQHFGAAERTWRHASGLSRSGLLSYLHLGVEVCPHWIQHNANGIGV